MKSALIRTLFFVSTEVAIKDIVLDRRSLVYSSSQVKARVRAGQELEFFISDAQGGSSLSIGERVYLGVAAERCFLFLKGKRFYL